jgi:hypothetical protein
LRERPHKAAKGGKNVAENARNPFGMSPRQRPPGATKKISKRPSTQPIVTESSEDP